MPLTQCYIDACYDAAGTMNSCTMIIPGIEQDCLAWFVHFEAETCEYHEEDAVDCSSATYLPFCERYEAYDSCEDVGYCDVAWHENGVDYNQTCSEFWDWHEEWFACRQIEDTSDCAEEAGVDHCQLTHYVQPCIDLQVCWVELTDLSGTYYNLTCTEYYGVIDGSYA